MTHALKPLKAVLTVALLLILTGILSCSKEGIQGPRGEAGSQGPKGDKGDVGSANVIYSKWLDIEPESSGFENYLYPISAPELTKDILDQGDIRVYLKDPLFGIMPLPNAVLYKSLWIRYMPNKIYVYSGNNMYDGNHGYYFRYVLIPGGVSK